VESIDIIEHNRLVLMQKRGAVHAERGRISIDPSSPTIQGSSHGLTFSSTCWPHYHQETQMAGRERLREGVKFSIIIDNDGIAWEMLRFGHQPSSCIGERLLAH